MPHFKVFVFPYWKPFMGENEAPNENVTTVIVGSQVWLLSL